MQPTHLSLDLLQHVEAVERKTLESMGWPTDPVAVEAMLSGALPTPPGCKGRKPGRDRERVRGAMMALILAGQARLNLMPSGNAQLAVWAAMIAVAFGSASLQATIREKAGWTAGKARGQAIATEAATLRSQIKAAATAYRRDTPYHPTKNNQGHLVAYLADYCDENGTRTIRKTEPTILRHLRALKLK